MYEDIRDCELVNHIESQKLKHLIHSFLTNGWKGMPILYCATLNCLVTGSHRLAALRYLEDTYNDYSSEKQETIDKLFESVETIDVSDIINSYCESNDCTFEQIDFSNLKDVFADTEIEKYKQELEW